MASSRYGGPYTPQRGEFAGQHFRSYFEYRNRVAKSRGYKSYSQQRAGQIPDNEESRRWYFQYGRQIPGAPESAEEWAIEHEFDWRTTPLPKDAIRPNSEFARLYREAALDNWRKTHDGPFARFLEYLELREPGSTYDVGDTPGRGT